MNKRATRAVSVAPLVRFPLLGAAGCRFAGRGGSVLAFQDPAALSSMAPAWCGSMDQNGGGLLSSRASRAFSMVRAAAF